MSQRTNDIFSEFDRIRERMEQAWRQMAGPPGAPRFCDPLIEPPVDIYETDSEIIVVVEIAGITEDEVEITIEGRTLLLEGERRPEARRPGRLYSQMEISHGPFRRELLLPADVNADEAKAEYARGLLEIAIPKVPAQTTGPSKVAVRQ